MINVLLALAGLALVTPAAQGARPAKAASSRAHAKATPSRAHAEKTASRPQAKDVGAKIFPSASTMRVAGWVTQSGDNRSLPYAIIDKPTASLFLYDANGKLLGKAPVLIGIAPGDDATPGVGSKKLAEIGPAEKTTPAGRFLAKFGLAAGGQRVLWVDYANSVAIHALPKDAAKKERRRERITSLTPDDNRITFGCINVPDTFYAKLVRPVFQKKGGYVYVLPDTKSLEEVFPRLRVEALTPSIAQ